MKIEIINPFFNYYKIALSFQYKEEHPNFNFKHVTVDFLIFRNHNFAPCKQIGINIWKKIDSSQYLAVFPKKKTHLNFSQEIHSDVRDKYHQNRQINNFSLNDTE